MSTKRYGYNNATCQSKLRLRHNTHSCENDYILVTVVVSANDLMTS